LCVIVSRYELTVDDLLHEIPEPIECAIEDSLVASGDGEGEEDKIQEADRFFVYTKQKRPASHNGEHDGGSGPGRHNHHRHYSGEGGDDGGMTHIEYLYRDDWKWLKNFDWRNVSKKTKSEETGAPVTVRGFVTEVQAQGDCGILELSTGNTIFTPSDSYV
jgi:hypothetical protein